LYQYIFYSSGDIVSCGVMLCCCCYSDLDMSALRAMGQVMSGLVLQSKMKSSDMFEEKGKVFMK